MIDTGSNSVAIIGLQGTGKTTYLGAFFAACDAAHEDMAITTYAGADREYLNGLADALAACERVERTSQTQPRELRLRVRLGRDAAERDLLVPDLSGELLRESMNDRVLDPQIQHLLTSVEACLLFVRADTILPAQRLADFAAAMLAAGERLAGETAAETPEDWTVELAATQVRLTDVVQELSRQDWCPRRLGLVVSAWDARSDRDEFPGAWVARELPLLRQVLDSSGIEWTAFGVSAQGGDFARPNDVAKLQRMALMERPFVQQGDGSLGGIGDPLMWALRDRQ